MGNMISEAIDVLTHRTGANDAAETVWIYGEMLWANPTAFEFVAIADKKEKRITIITDSVKRYRDGDSALFLIQMGSTMAHILDIEDFSLSPDELDRKRRFIRTDRPY